MKAPGFGENRKASLSDLATLTGAQVESSLGYIVKFPLEKFSLFHTAHASMILWTSPGVLNN